MKRPRPPESSLEPNLRDFCVTHCIQVYLKLQEEMREVIKNALALTEKPFDENCIASLANQGRDIVTRSRNHLTELPTLGVKEGFLSTEAGTACYFWHDIIANRLLGAYMQLSALIGRTIWDKAATNMKETLQSLGSEQASLEQELDQCLGAANNTRVLQLITEAIILTHSHLADGSRPDPKISAEDAEKERLKFKQFTGDHWETIHPLYDEERKEEAANEQIGIEVNYQIKILRNTKDHTQFLPDPMTRLHIEVNKTCDELIIAHRSLIAHIASGLAINAMQAMDGNPGIVLIEVKETGRKEDMVLLRVSDTGRGFTERMIEALNNGEEYVSTTGGNGKNLGMIRKRVVDLGGTFTVSNYKGGGGCVAIQLPLKVFQEEKKPAKKSPRKKAAEKNR